MFAVAEPSASLAGELERYGITAKIGAEHVFETVNDARSAFHAAQAAP